MENKARGNIKDLLVDTGKYLPDLPVDRVMVMKFEIANIKKKYDRELAISYIATNFAPNKHFAITGLHGMSDTVVMEFIEKIEKDIDAELEKRD